VPSSIYFQNKFNFILAHLPSGDIAPDRSNQAWARLKYHSDITPFLFYFLHLS
jgi:hypothetical protein